MYSIISNSTLSYLLLVKSQKSKKKKKKNSLMILISKLNEISMLIQNCILYYINNK